MRNFTTAENGYNKVEVNNFIVDITKEYEGMLNKLKESQEKLNAMQAKLDHYKNLESTLNKAVLVAEDSSNQMKKIARDEAKMIIDNAKKNASHIVNDALLKAQETELEADKIRRSLKIYKARIRKVVEEQLSIVDDVDNITEK